MSISINRKKTFNVLTKRKLRQDIETVQAGPTNSSETKRIGVKTPAKNINRLLRSLSYRPPVKTA